MGEREIKRVLIAGIGGAGGSQLAEFLSEHHSTVELHGILRKETDYTRQNLQNVSGRATLHKCDLTKLEPTEHVLTSVKPDVIFSIASKADVKDSFARPQEFLTNNINATATLFEAVRVSGLDPIVKHCSSSEVYGDVDPKNTPTSELCPPQPNNPYAVSKVAQDFLAFTYFRSYGMKIITTRAFGYVNSRRTNLFTTSFALQVARIEAGLQEELSHGDLSSVRTLIDARDIMAAYWEAVKHCTPGEVYNVGGTATISVGEFLEVLKKKAKTKIKTRQDPKLLRPADMKLQVPDTTKFRAATKWAPKISFDEIVANLLEVCRERVKLETAGKV